MACQTAKEKYVLQLQSPICWSYDVQKHIPGFCLPGLLLRLSVFLILFLQTHMFTCPLGTERYQNCFTLWSYVTVNSGPTHDKT